jgi:putative transposase
VRFCQVAVQTTEDTRLRRAHRGYGDTFFIDEVVMEIQGKQQSLWRAVDQNGEVVDVFLHTHRDGKAAKRFFTRLIKRHQDETRKIVTDKLRCCSSRTDSRGDS